MNNKHILQQRFFRLLSKYSQRKVSALEFTEAIEKESVKTKLNYHSAIQNTVKNPLHT